MCLAKMLSGGGDYAATRAYRIERDMNGRITQVGDKPNVLGYSNINNYCLARSPSLFRLKCPSFAFSSIFSWLILFFERACNSFWSLEWDTLFSNLLASWSGPKFDFKVNYVNLSPDKNWSKHIYVHCRLDFKRREGIKVMPQCSTLCAKHKHCIYQSGP